MYRGEATRLEWSCLAFNVAAMDLWDDEAWFELVSAQARLARATGTLSYMAFALSYLAGHHTLAGDLSQAAGLLAESQRLDLDTGNRQKNVPYGSLQLAAWRGEEAAALGFREVLTRGRRRARRGRRGDRRRVRHRSPLQRPRSVRPRERGSARCSRDGRDQHVVLGVVGARRGCGAKRRAGGRDRRPRPPRGANRRERHRLGARRRGALARTPRRGQGSRRSPSPRRSSISAGVASACT